MQCEYCGNKLVGKRTCDSCGAPEDYKTSEQQGFAELPVDALLLTGQAVLAFMMLRCK